MIFNGTQMMYIITFYGVMLPFMIITNGFAIAVAIYLCGQAYKESI